MSIKKFSFVGLLNTAVGLTVIYFSMWIGINEIVSNVLGYTAGFFLGFFLNSSWTFSYKGNAASAILTYLVLIVFSYLVNLGTVLTLIHILGVNRYIAQVAGILPYTIIVYTGCKYIVFRDSAQGSV